MSEIAYSLTSAERIVLDDCEQRIERGLKTFVEVGSALAMIRDNRLYRAERETFEDYCQDRWGFDRTRAQNFITAARTVLEISNTGLPAPERESQARELARVPESDRADVWRETVERTDGKPTAAAIRDTYASTRPSQPARPPVEEPSPGSAASTLGSVDASEAPTAGTVGAGETAAGNDTWPADGAGDPHPPAPALAAPVEGAGAAGVTLPDGVFEDMDAALDAASDSWPSVAQPGIAAALDRYAPDADGPYREWRRNFLAAVNGAYRPISRSTTQEVAERADDECVVELVRVAAELTSFADRVRQIRAANRPKNVLTLVRPA